MSTRTKHRSTAKRKAARPGDPARPAPPAGIVRRPPDWVIALCLAAGTLVLFLPCVFNEFVSFDDPYYVTENPVVRQGLTLEGARWAFTTTHFANWLPVTWLSHMLDVQLFGLDPRGH